MGCGSSKNQVRDDENNMAIRSSENLEEESAAKTYKSNVKVENDAVYTGEFVNGRKEGQGTQKCTLYCVFLCVFV